MTSQELIQQSIDGIKLDGRRKRVQARFDADPDVFIAKAAHVLKKHSDPDARKLATALNSGSVGAIDPEKLKKWIDLLVKFLPLILALFA